MPLESSLPSEKAIGGQSVDEGGWGAVPTEAFDELAGLATEICGVPMGSVALHEEGAVRFLGRVGLNLKGCALGDWFFSKMPGRKELLVVRNAAEDTRFSGSPLVTGELGIRFFAGAPLLTVEGEVVGALCVMDRAPGDLTGSQQEALEKLGRLVVMQLESCRKADELSGSERRLRAIFDNEPECVKLLGPDCKLLEMNPAGLRMIEADSMQQVVGHCVLGMILPEHREAFAELTARVMNGGTGSLEFEINGLKGTRRWLETHATPMRNEQGEIISLLGITRDITQRKRSMALLAGQREAMELIADGAPLSETLPVLAEFIESQSQGLLCSVLLVDGDGVHLRHGAAPSLPEAYNEAVDGLEIGEGVGSCGTAAFRQQSVYVENLETDPLWEGLRHVPLEHGLKACWSTPIFDREGKVCGTFAIYYRESGLPQAEHLQLIEIATNIASIAIGRHREGERLKRNHALLKGVMEGSTDAIYVKDLEGRYQFINEAGAKLAALTPEDIIGRTDAELLPEEIARHFRQLDLEVLAADAPITREESGVMAGRKRVLSANKSPWRDAEGRTLGVIGVSRDITESRQAEADLHAEEERFRLFMDHSPTTAWLKDEDGRYVYMNRPFEECYGVKLEDWRGKTDEDLWPGEMATEFRKNDLKALASDTAIEVVEFARNAQGEVIHQLCSKFPFRDAEGKRYVAGIGLDISERVRAETELKRSEANYRSLVESASDGILVSDMKGKLLDVNAAGCEMFGYSHREMIGMRNLEIISPEDADRMIPEMERLKVGKVMRSEWKTRRKDGSIFPSEVSVTVLPDGRALAIVRDVTERKRLEQQFLRVQRMDSIGTLAGGIAHDLNNALAPILMALDLLKLRFPDSESHELIGMIGASAKRGAEMVKQVLSFARGVEGQKMDVEFGGLLQEVEKIANDTFMKNIKVAVDYPEDLWKVVGDSTQLHQVLVNLCVNARDAMQEGGRLKLTAENHILDAHYVGMSFGTEPGPYVLIRVEDSGTGMPPELLEKIFDPFFTTKEVGSGTGLGLSTSQAIVTRHGGFIQVYSELGKGTRFNIYLPARVEEEGAEHLPSKRPGGDLPRGNGELVLVIEDEILVRQITRDTLEAFGYRVLLAVDGADAVSVYASHKDEIAVVLTDMMMPVMDGPATIQVLQRMNPEVRIIATSGLSSTDHIGEVTQLGVKSFLAKPYTAEKLLAILRDELDPA
ncbi:MAG: PAS domain-containing protein [Luteolibacter sp.]